MKVPISAVTLEKSIYPRVVDKKGLPFWAIAHKYYLAMKQGAKFPPIVLTQLRGRNILVDGWNRVVATKKLGKNSIEATFIACKTFDDAYVESLRLNTVHGTNLSPYEVAIAIRNLKRKGLSYSEIAEIVHIPADTAQATLKSREGAHGIIAKRIVAPVKRRITDSNQRTLAATSQISLIKQLLVLIDEDLLDMENKDVVKAIGELASRMSRLTLTA